MNKIEDSAAVRTAMVDLAVECWRFQKLIAKALGKMDADDAIRFVNQTRFFGRKIDECLLAAGARLVNIEGQLFDVGAAVSALNLDDFRPGEEAIVEQMIEPIVMGEHGLLRAGTVLLRKA